MGFTVSVCPTLKKEEVMVGSPERMTIEGSKKFTKK
jgi:hypothetical protein